MEEKDNKIHKDMTFGELLQQYPKAGPILGSFGLHCIGCHLGTGETIEQGVMAHGMDKTMLDSMIKQLNEQAV